MRIEANRVLVAVEETLQLLKSKRLVMPDDVDPRGWILSGGKAKPKAKTRTKKQKHPFGEICDSYLEDQQQKQESTRTGEEIHILHLKRILSCSVDINGIDLDKLKRYRSRRYRQKQHGQRIHGATIKKELVTFRQIWIWAKQNGFVDSLCSLLDENGRWKL